eukprot:COSAG02_NODE_33691_length_496_cov_0.863980_1_plen_119_part_10
MYVSFGVYDMALWIAFRNAIDLLTPYEDIVMDGVTADASTFTQVSRRAFVSAMQESGNMLIASSTVPHGQPTSFTIVARGATAAWLLCDLQTNRSVPVSASGHVSWSSSAEDGSVLILS